MDKLLTENQKIRANKQQHKNKKKQQPIKVVYITNPIKVNATPSEFRALVQELTGQDAADFSETARFAVANGGGAAGGGRKMTAADEENAHAVKEVVTKLGQTCDGGEEEVLENGSDPMSVFGSYLDDDDDAFCTTKMLENYPGLMASWREGAHDV